MKIIWLYLILFLTTQLFSQENIGQFFNDLYQDYPAYVELRNSEYYIFCKKYSIDSSLLSNRNKFFNIYFLHDLFTGSSAQNFTSGGILQIPYFWHWVDPNPRHEITFWINHTKLNRIKPPKRFFKYKSFADIDRIPSLYLADLLTDKPKYFHDECSGFYTFGWCSEREMAYNSLLEILGFKSKIKQSGIHTWSEVLFEFKTTNSEIKLIVFKVDNTFDIINYILVNSNIPVKQWQNKIGRGSTIRWYNKKAHSGSEVNAVKNLIVSSIASKRIKPLIETWLNKK